MLTVMAAALLLAQGAPAQPPAAKSDKPAKAKLICTREASIGSVIPRRVCRTPEQVEAEQRAAQRAGDRLGNNGAVCQGEGC